MPQLRNTTTGETFDVSDVDAARMTQADPSLQVVGDIATSVGTDSRKAQVARSADDVSRLAGVDAATADERAAHTHANYLKDKSSTLGAAVRGGLSMATFGATDYLTDPETQEADQLHHSLARGVGSAVGLGATLAFGNDLGVGKLLGAGRETEAVSAGARALATTADALDAEHVASGLSSKALLGGEATNAGERALARSGRALDEATIARSGLKDVPADLIGMDDAALREAANAEKLALKSQAAEERASLEELRKPQREQLVEDVRDMHQELQSEQPIFKAVAGADVRAVDGVKDIASQLNKSYRGLRGKLDNPLALAESPDRLLADLQMRQTALQSLQAKAPEIRAVLGDDARAAALDHVDGALEQTKAQIERIKSLNSRANPVTSSRLTALEAGVSPRLNAIDAARDALKVAPEVGLVQKGVKAGTFAAGTALAHAIPGVGILAPFAGKWASDTIGRAFEHLATAGAGSAAASRAALDAFLSTAKSAAPRAVTTATQVLGRTAFGPSSSEPKTGDRLADLYKARSAELRQQTQYDPTGAPVIRPEARQAIAAKLAPIAQVNPRLADQLETIAVRKVEFLSSVMPRRPDIGGLQIGPDNWRPSDLEMRSWARSVRGAEDPAAVEMDLAHGIVTPESAHAYRAVYPERFAAMQAAIFHAAPALSKSLPMKKKIALSMFTGIPCTPAMTPNVLAVLQASFSMEPGSDGGTQAPRAQPQFGALGSLPSADKTAAQRSEEP